MHTMTVHFWGTRGSIPTPSRKTEKYGGNTTCLEVRYGETVVVLDAGSGICMMSEAWTRNPELAPDRAYLLLTHLHWDHIQGFPFFTPAYLPQNSFVIYGEKRSTGGIKELLSGQMREDYFPVPLSAMRADLEFRSTGDEFQVGDVNVKSFPLPHPDGALGYRLHAGKSTFVLATDCELDQVALNRERLGEDHTLSREYDPAVLEHFRGANLLVIDCQYTDTDYRSKHGWGHNSLSTVVDFCAQVRPDMVALCHHDPQRTDDAVTMMVLDADTRLKQCGANDVLVFGAREGLLMSVDQPRRPPAVSMM